MKQIYFRQELNQVLIFNFTSKIRRKSKNKQKKHRAGTRKQLMECFNLLSNWNQIEKILFFIIFWFTMSGWVLLINFLIFALSIFKLKTVALPLFTNEQKINHTSMANVWDSITKILLPHPHQSLSLASVRLNTERVPKQTMVGFR